MTDQTSLDLPSAGRYAEGCGSLLRQAREHAGLSLQEVGSQLKMPVRVVQALEEENWQVLGAPVFLRGQLRSYAKLLKVDVDPYLERVDLQSVAPAELVSRSHTPHYQRVLESIARGVPFFGICVGMQLLFEGSDESPDQPGLGLFSGRVVRFDLQPPLKIPHMGWNPCSHGPAAHGNAILQDTPEGTSFYFVHSYYPVPADESVIALRTDHGIHFAAAVARENIFACQFHPEKSQRAGLQLLQRFVTL